MKNSRVIVIFLTVGLIFATTALSQQTPEGGAKLGVWSPELEKKWWAENPEPEQWFDLVDRMSITLRDAHVRHGLQKMISNPHWTGWMLHTRWLALFPEDAADESWRETFVKIGQNAGIRNRFLGALVPTDDQQKAIEILCRIAEKYPADFFEFTNLAIAFAIVFDQPVPESWPHAFVEQSKVPTGNPDPVDRFAFYVKSQREAKLVLDLSKITVQNLKFLVDSPLEFNELIYAQQIKITSPEKLADYYKAVPYDTARIQRKEYLWPKDEYRLFTIGKGGGICMDQAFFVSQSGKALGIPTLLFVGQGMSGEHAWVGFLHRNGKWEMEAARYRGEKYPIGQAYDPQTWERITDAEIAALQEGAGVSNAKFNLGQILLQWAMLNRDDELYPEILTYARRALAKDPRPWQLEADWLEENETETEPRIRFWTEWVRNFSGNKDLEVEGQMRLIALFEEAEKPAEAERLRSQIMSHNRSKRFDLSIAIAADPIFRKLRKRQFPEAKDAFDSAMRRFRSQAGGFLFYNLIEPYVKTCLQEGQIENAKDALQYLDKGFNAQAGSILDQDMKAMRERVAAAS